MRGLLVILALLLVLLSAACSTHRQPVGVDRLKACRSSQGPTDAYCGTLSVWENRSAKTGRKIALKIVILPGLRREPAPDPLFFLAGGPGQGAAKMASVIRDLFRNIQTDRDIVLVDQRGTGDSNPLECKPGDDDDFNQDPNVAVEKLRACVTSLESKADLKQYTTPIAMDDLDDVRDYLGYAKIDLYGGSYGTRAAIVYTRRHEPHVRAVILDGVAPTDMRLPLYMARDSERALDLLLRDCDKDAGCRKRYPNLGERFRKLLAQLSAHPQHVKLIHPRTGVETEVDVRRLTVAGATFAALYSPQVAALLPLLIERAEQGDFQGFLALGQMNEGMAETMAEGMHFSVVCSEDAPRISPGSIAQESDGTFLGAEAADWRAKTCDFWPHAAMDSAYYDIQGTAVPALILSGELDPVTPPQWGQQVAARWTNSRHIVVPGMGHGTLANGCVMKVMREFLNDGSAAHLNVDCIQRVKRPPFFLGPAGPDPLAGALGGVSQP